MSRSIPLEGLATKSIAPSSSAFSVMSAPSRDSELTITMGRGFDDMIISVACKPSMWGMLMSMVITSGRSCSESETASRPSRASPTTSMFGSAVRMLCSTLRMNAESSVINARILFPGSAISSLLHRTHRRCLRCSADQRCNFRHKSILLHRLHHERSRAFFQGAITVLGTGARGDDHDRNVPRGRVLPHVRDQFVTVGTRHLKIGDDQVALH